MRLRACCCGDGRRRETLRHTRGQTARARRCAAAGVESRDCATRPSAPVQARRPPRRRLRCGRTACRRVREPVHRRPCCRGLCRRRSLLQGRMPRESRSGWRCLRCSAALGRASDSQTARNRAAEPAARPARRPAYPRDGSSKPPECRAWRQSPGLRRPARCRQSCGPRRLPRAADDRASGRGSQSGPVGPDAA